MSTFISGCKPSPPDDRDYIYEHIRSRTVATRSTLPKEYTCVPNLFPVRDQGSQGTCLAQSITCMKEVQEKRDISLSTSLSPQFIYNLRSNQPEEGMYGRDGMSIVKRLGVCLEPAYKYGRKDPIPQDALLQATNHKIVSYARITTVDGVKRSLIENGPCVICFPTYNTGPQFWKPQSLGDKIIGGHAVAIVGYDKMGFKIRNSWGPQWGQNGYTLYPYSDFGAHWEIWTAVDGRSDPEIPNVKPTNCLNLLCRK